MPFLLPPFVAVSLSLLLRPLTFLLLLMLARQSQKKHVKQRKNGKYQSIKGQDTHNRKRQYTCTVHFDVFIYLYEFVCVSFCSVFYICIET